MKKKQLFSLFLKKLSNGTMIYYYTTYDETGKRRQFSTGKTDKQEAYAECYKRLAEGTIVKKSKLYFSSYTEDWFKHDTCPYCSVRIAKGKKYSKGSLDNKRALLNKHIKPVFDSLRLDHITTIHIENYIQAKKAKGYAVNTINIQLSILRQIMGEALRIGLIMRNPCDGVIKFAKQKTTKGILKDEEVAKLLDKSNIDDLWTSYSHYLINYTAATTGCRVSEILALTKNKVHKGYLEISASYDRKYGLKSTKSGATRYVPISNLLENELIEMVEKHNGRFIFSSSNKLKPISYNYVNRVFKEALSKIGISNEERLKRGITFHSYRHYANTKLRESGVSDAIVREIIGHKSADMTENYSHIDTRSIKFTDLKISV